MTQTNIDLIKTLHGKRGYTDNAQYREAMIRLRFESLSDEDLVYFQDIYLESKDIFSRKQILDALVLRALGRGLKDFFLAAFKKERYLDMRLTAIRGYAACASEREVAPLMEKFLNALIKIPAHTPNNYQEYEMLRSKFGLPYLVEKYGYEFFKKTLTQVETQYSAMEDKYKNLFTLDENGLHVALNAK